MPNDSAALVSSLISGLIGVFGALGGVYLNNRKQSSQRNTELRRDRGEELYSTVVEWLDGLFHFSIRRCGVMRGEITYNECIDQDIEWAKSKKTAPIIMRFEMLIDVYFPSTRAAYDRVVQMRSNLNEIESNFKRTYMNGYTNGSTFLGPYLDAQRQIEEAGKELLKQVIVEIRKIR
jgi:hypothetical protein